VLLLPLSLPGEIEQVLERTSYKWMTEWEPKQRISLIFV
jgi:hypothetical protein